VQAFFTELFKAILSPELAAAAGAIVAALIPTLLLVSFVAGSAIFFIWLERKVCGRIQDRLGPTRVGGKFGWLQTIADGMKLLVKEDVIPGSADQMLFRLGPYISFCGAFLAFLALPFADGWVAQNLNVAVFFMLAVMSTEVFGVILAGYGSGSKWSLFGGMREAAQVVSYEVPMAICVLVPVIVAGSMNLNTIGRQQAGFLNHWYVFHDPFTFLAFWTYFTCATASCKRAPFDLAEAESELVAGFHTEYSGLRWSFFFMAEYGAMFAVSGIATILFLGGWNTGLPSRLLDFLHGLTGHATWAWVVGNVIGVVVFIVKGWLLVFVMMWVRWTLPRLRIDQVMMMCLKYLLPISCVLLLGVSLWVVAVPPVVSRVLGYVGAVAAVLGLVWLLYKMVATPHNLPFQGVPEEWWTAKPAEQGVVPK
jgi:NADH-quinone oxidoreductase subunit H